METVRLQYSCRSDRWDTNGQIAACLVVGSPGTSAVLRQVEIKHWLGSAILV